MHKTIAVILARGGSKGIPKKNIIEFCGAPLLAWTIRHCLTCLPADAILLSSDSTDILSIGRQYGIVCIRRPDELATDTASSEDAILHALEQVPAAETIVFPQVTSPVRRMADIGNALSFFYSENFDALFSATELLDSCIWDGAGNSITYDYKNRARRQNRAPLYLENGSFYITKRSIYTQYRNRLGGKIGMYLMPNFCAHEIDTLDDLKLCANIMTNMSCPQTRQLIIGGVGT